MSIPFYEIRRNAKGEYYFTLKGGNGKAVMYSDLYTTKQAVRDGIQSVRNIAPFADLRDLTGESVPRE